MEDTLKDPPLSDWQSEFPVGESNGIASRELHRCRIGRDRASATSWGHEEGNQRYRIVPPDARDCSTQGIPCAVTRRLARHKKREQVSATGLLGGNRLGILSAVDKFLRGHNKWHNWWSSSIRRGATGVSDPASIATKHK
ncbi:uncharacterized protein PITG_04429 [Phytophthora infestans T30-4]|uniref:Uncharacterized protein n=1 Tax=Phytophthora infestans (strain T30-4) TaxID=403677 RepID=D0N187_PHYIT|nr:uncharacterized protein PITG_04429 [Phytophthora infestans T30-4]EEY67400.1 hypothetical protein PITG_04429 [Phytophthora infestans T30-4]|eukprot:XP_002906048.1 hypothetical protein PITG_04429 [Phytophthora infestans T30-4]